MPAPEYSEKIYSATAEHIAYEIEDLLKSTKGFSDPYCELLSLKVSRSGADCKMDFNVKFDPSYFYPGWDEPSPFGDSNSFYEAITPTHVVLVDVLTSLRFPLEKYTEDRFTMSVNPSHLRYSDTNFRISGTLLVQIIPL